MPQMSPILWLNLYVTFSATLILFVVMCFFYKMPTSTPDTAPSKTKQELSWKW